MVLASLRTRQPSRITLLDTRILQANNAIVALSFTSDAAFIGIQPRRSFKVHLAMTRRTQVSTRHTNVSKISININGNNNNYNDGDDNNNNNNYDNNQ